MNEIIKNNKYDNIVNSALYSLFFVHQLFFVFSTSDYSRSNPNVKVIANYIIIVSFLGMCLTALYYFFRGKFSTKEIAIYILLAIPLLISLYNYRVVMVISNLFYAAIFKNVDANKSLNIALIATIVGYIINILFSVFTKYTGNVGQIRYGMSRIRYGLGFCYAYFTGYYYLTIVLLYLLVRGRLEYSEYLILFVVGLVIFILSDAKAAFAYTLLALLLHLLFVKYKFNFPFSIFRLAVVLAYPISTLLACFLPVFYIKGNRFWDIFNRIVNGRLLLTQNALANCGWKWFGQTAHLWNPGVHYADSAIVLMLIQNGLIVLIMSVTFMTLFSYFAVKINYRPLMVVLFIIAIRSIFDMGFMTMQLGPVIVLFYDVLNKYRNGVVCDY